MCDKHNTHIHERVYCMQVVGGAAEVSGVLLVGDMIHFVDGFSVLEKNVEQVKSLILGVPGR